MAPDARAVDAPDFTIVTPSRNQLGWLKRCRRSVVDQQGVTCEHRVMDAASTDGTPEWLALEAQADRDGRFAFVSEKDDGMYDAVNRGFAAARGEFVGYLNCDEQYLPDTLLSAKRVFDAHPDVDVVFGNAILIRPDGSLLALQKAYPLRWWYVLASTCYVYSCTLFLRRRIVEAGFTFDTRFRDNGDAELLARLDRAGVRSLHVDRFFSAFALTGQNMSGGDNAQRERAAILAAAPAWVQLLRLPIRGLRRAEKILRGGYREPTPFRYAVYDDEDGLERQAFSACQVSYTWRDH